MYDTDQLDELLELWDCLDNGQREGLLRLLRAIIEEEGGEENGPSVYNHQLESSQNGA